MFLKSLDISGFKSFADKTHIEFHKGVTAIVGPNGCGKSNVLDAIRWALGEQSAKALRGGSMQDVIFGGTDSRKPLAMAEVTLTFSECETALGTEYHDVAITRRVFRDGAGEFEINKTPCRLRDIHQLFMDTGIGRSAYSIMEQGKIDLILSSKPEDRRAVFEEAAGITRFKSQRREALRKLEATEANLLRVSDIIKEVRRQLGSLQRQAAKARRFREVFDRLRLLDTNLARLDFAELQSSLRQGEEKVRQLELEFGTVESGVENREAEVRQARIDLDNCDLTLQGLESRRQRAENTIAQSESNIRNARERIAEMEARIERNRLERAAAEEKLRTLEDQITAASAELSDLAAREAAARQSVAESQAAHDTARLGVGTALRERGDLEQEVNRLAADLHSTQGRLATIDMQRHTCRARLIELEREEQDGQGHAAELDSLLAEITRRSAEAQAQLDNLAARRQTEETRLQAARQAITAARQTLQETESRIGRLAARRDALKRLVASRTGFSAGSRRLLEQFQGRGLAGPLLGFVRARPGFEEAVELCLGAAWEALVIDQPDTLPSMLELLAQSGSATLVLPQPASHEPSGDLPPQSVLHLVEIAPPAGPWLRRLLRHHCVVAHAAEAEALRAQHPHLTVVTQQGEIFHADGWMLRGKREHQGHSLLATENDLRAVELELTEAESGLGAKTTQVEGLRADLDAITRLLDEMEQERRAVEGALAALRFEEKGLARQKEEGSRRLETLARERANLQEQESRGREQESTFLATLAQLRDQHAEKTAALEQFAGRLAELNASAEREAARLSDARVQLASVEQQLKSLTLQVESLHSRKTELAETMATREKESAEDRDKITATTEAIARLEAQIDAARSELATLATDLDAERSRRTEIQARFAALDEAARADRRRLSELQQVKGKEEVALAEQRLNLKALVERVARAYHVALDEKQAAPQSSGSGTSPTWLTSPAPAPEPPETGPEPIPADPAAEDAAPPPEPVPELPIEDREAARREVQELQARIDGMGPVNVDAIAEFEELEQRLAFLENQERDLTTSRQQLLEAIQKINETTLTMFRETFAKIQQNFTEMFVELFGGGKAELTLVDSGDPLESGIEIVARPPGKQLQSISLLSGGEKTMTAVALLFSIYMVKPSPFCVLDEMDAPLDESNISRFIRLLQRFVTQSQFVVITHNKRTISSADVLYGVTMEEHGVSKMVSIKLARREETPLFPDGDVPTIAESVRGQA
ncbi:MAG: chromosome segregation protein SMC [Gemmataceae bacterium]